MTGITHRLINEKELFAAFANGDEAAFRQIYHHYNKRLAPFVWKMTRSEDITKEVIQEIFIKLWLNREAFHTIQHPTAYIFRLATNKAMDGVRKIAQDNALVQKLIVMHPDWTNNTEDTVIFNESLAEINSAVEQLPSQRQLIYRMSREEGMSLDEIAEQLDLSRSTVKNQLGHALRFIREFLERRASMFTLLLFLYSNKK
jgi:RNA polymerase sigma-70 factor (ECF subfamily)